MRKVLPPFPEFLTLFQQKYTKHFRDKGHTIQVTQHTFLRDLHSDGAQRVEFLTDFGQSLKVPVTVHTSMDLLKPGTYFIVRDFYDEMNRILEWRRRVRNHKLWTWTAYSMVPLSIYGLFTVKMVFTFLAASFGSAILTYQQIQSRLKK